MMNPSTETAGSETIPASILQAIVHALGGMRFGQITVIVQDGRVIQIDRTERQRFPGDKEVRP